MNLNELETLAAKIRDNLYSEDVEWSDEEMKYLSMVSPSNVLAIIALCRSQHAALMPFAVLQDSDVNEAVEEYKQMNGELNE
jgi:hypothetical protein